MKQSKEESVQKMRTALKDKEKAEKVLCVVTAKAETLADAQFTISTVSLSACESWKPRPMQTRWR